MMINFVPGFRRSGIGVALGLTLVLALILLAPAWPVGAQAPIDSTLLATSELSVGPAGRIWAIRDKHPLNVEHTHVGGFIFMQGGSSSVIMEGNKLDLQPNEALWIPEGVPHTHVADSG